MNNGYRLKRIKNAIVYNKTDNKNLGQVKNLEPKVEKHVLNSGSMKEFLEDSTSISLS